MSERAFRLEVLDGGLGTLVFDLPESKLNIFTRPVLAELEALLDQLGNRQDLRCLVLLSGKDGGFIAGADVAEIAGIEDPVAAEAASRLGQRLFTAWERLPFPTVAAVRGTCLGGGTELALASDYVLLSDHAELRIGLPEVRLGILPGWGGCSRLPRRLGLAGALDIILAGRTLRPRAAFRAGLADALIPDASFPRHVREFAARVAAGEAPRRRRGGVKRALLEGNPIGRALVLKRAREQVLEKTRGHYPAPVRAIEVVRVGVEDGLEAGLDAEARAIAELAVGPTCKNLVHVFNLMEGAKRGAGAGGAAPPIRFAGLIGAGVMGGAIAQLISERADIPVRMKDIGAEALASGMAHAAKLFRRQVERRWIGEPEARRKMTLLQPTLDYHGFERAELVIEAVVETLEVKQQVFLELSEVVEESAVLASNTSSLSIDRIAGATPNPERVVGLHFFNPVDRMPLVEVIVGPRTGPAAVDTAAAFARRLGKTPVVVKDAPGFLVNRLLMVSMTEALWLLEEGHAIEEIDSAMEAWGMPMGPLALADQVGLDVAVKVAHILGDAFPSRLELPGWLDDLAAPTRLGAKDGRGFYRYKDGKRTRPDSRIYRLMERPARAEVGEPIAHRVVLPMVNEAARCLDEGVVADAGDLDLAMILGTGFPPFRGGLCRWADAAEVEQVSSTLERMAADVGPRLEPSAALARAVEDGGFYARWPSGSST